MKYKYMMYKDGNSISIDLLYEGSTTERNGLEVKVPIKSNDIYEFAKSIKKQLVYFENLYVIDSSNLTNIEYEFNNFVIKKYNNFNINTLDSSFKEINLVLGKVRYPLRIENLSKPYNKYVKNYSISLTFDIGDLEVTPNREEILYSTKNIIKIEDKLDSAIKEIQILLDKEFNKDFTNLTEYVKFLEGSNKLILLEKDDNQVYIKVPKQKLNVTLKGEHYDKKNFLGMYSAIMNYRGITIDYVLNNNKINYRDTKISINNIKINIYKIYKADLRFVKNITKTYIREELSNGSYFIRFKNLKYYYKKYIKNIENELKYKYNYYKEPWDYDSKIFKVIFKDILKNMLSLKKFDDSSVPNQWILDKKQKAKKRRQNIKKNDIDWKQYINLYKLRDSDRGYKKITSDSEAHKLSELNTKFKKLTVYSKKGNTNLRDFYKIAGKNINCVEVAPSKMKLLKKVENFVNIDDFMNLDYKLIRNIGTAEYINKNLPFLDKIHRIGNIKSISEKLEIIIDKLYYFKEKYSVNQYYTQESTRSLVEEIYKLCEDNNYFNEEIKSKVVNNLTMLKNAQCLVYFSEEKYGRIKIPDNKLNIAVDYILSRKLFRPNIPAVFKLKKETIFNNKIEENENN